MSVSRVGDHHSAGSTLSTLFMLGEGDEVREWLDVDWVVGWVEVTEI